MTKEYEVTFTVELEEPFEKFQNLGTADNLAAFSEKWGDLFIPDTATVTATTSNGIPQTDPIEFTDPNAGVPASISITDSAASGNRLMRFRKLPVEIEAVQLTWRTWSEVCELLGDALLEVNPDGARIITADEASDTCGEGATGEFIALDVRTVHGELATVRHGDWIIPEAKPGRFYPCKPDIFEATYEPVAQA